MCAEPDRFFVLPLSKIMWRLVARTLSCADAKWASEQVHSHPTCAFRIPSCGYCTVVPCQRFNPGSGIRHPVRAEQNGHGTGRRAGATDTSLISASGGSRSDPILVRTRPGCKHRVQNSRMGLWHPALQQVPCPVC